MPIKLTDLKNRTRKIQVEFQGETLEVEYRINVVTPEFLHRLDTLAKENITDNLPYQICEAVERWDLVDDDGEELAPTMELLRSLSTEFLTTVIRAIQNDMEVDAAQKKG